MAGKPSKKSGLPRSTGRVNPVLRGKLVLTVRRAVKPGPVRGKKKEGRQYCVTSVESETVRPQSGDGPPPRPGQSERRRGPQFGIELAEVR